MAVILNGTAFTGYAQLTPGSLGPTAFTIRNAPGGPAYTLQPGERMRVHGVAINTNDPALPLVTVDLGAGSYNVASVYVATGKAYTDNIPSTGGAPIFIGVAGVVPRVTASAVTAARTIEAKITGVITRS